MVVVSWIALHCGVWVTLAAVVVVIYMMGAGAVIAVRRIRLRHQASISDG